MESISLMDPFDSHLSVVENQEIDLHMLEHNSRGQYRKHVICFQATKWLFFFLDLDFSWHISE